MTSNKRGRMAAMLVLPVAALLALLGAADVGARAKSRSDESTQVARNLAVFNQLYKELATFYVDTIDTNRAIETAIMAMLDEIDPYTEYIPESDREAFTRQTTGEYAGIGSYIVERNGATYISEPQEGSPAQRAGLRPGDRIVTIDGDTVLRLPSSDVSARLRGQAGTDVTVTVERPWLPAGADSVMTFRITRGKIVDNSVVWSGIIDGDNGIGYIYLSSFTERTPQEVKEALDALRTWPGGLRGLVLDLRGNGGGLVESAVKLLGYFLPKGTEVLRQRGRQSLNDKIYKTSASEVTDTRLPLVVLTDASTASSSEIVAGTVQDLDRGVILGTRSFGKGLVQTSRQLPYDNLLKVTIAKYYLPSGRLIQAIDYSRRNPDGTVARIPDSLTSVFRTAAGREVRDGGGITPDIVVEPADINRLVWNLVRDQWIFDYANRYRNSHDSLPGGTDAATFRVTDDIYADFKATIDPSRFQYDRVCETILDQLRQAASTEGYGDTTVTAAIDSLQRLLHHDLAHDLDLHRARVESYLAPEIVERYHHQGGRVRATLNDDAALDTAVAVLNNPERYRSLLRPRK